MPELENSYVHRKMFLSNKYHFVFWKMIHSTVFIKLNMFMTKQEQYIIEENLITQRSLSNNVFYCIFVSE